MSDLNRPPYSEAKAAYPDPASSANFAAALASAAGTSGPSGPSAQAAQAMADLPLLGGIGDGGQALMGPASPASYGASGDASGPSGGQAPAQSGAVLALERGLLPLPPTATEEERRDFEQKLRILCGVPETADGYGDFGYGEAVDKSGEEYRYYSEAFHAAGLSPGQAKKLLDRHLEWVRGQNEMLARRQDDVIRTYREEVKHRFMNEVGGPERFKTYAETANQGFRAAAQGAGIGPDEAKGLLSIMGDDPRFIKIFHAIGRMYREDELVSGSRARIHEEGFEEMFSKMFNHGGA